MGMQQSHVCCWAEQGAEKNSVNPGRIRVTIDMVPDIALIEIFDFYMAEALGYGFSRSDREVWIILAHVCRKWREIIFGSPYRLNVRLYFKPQRTVRAMLDTWPPLPISIWCCVLTIWNVDNVIEALEHADRIHKFELSDGSRFCIEKVLAAMQKPFPSLEKLAIKFYEICAEPVVPDSLLSGSAPLLRSLQLRKIRFPLPLLRNILLSATNLVELHILEIPYSGSISPEAMVACLSGLNRLEELELGFQFSHHWESRHLPSSTHCFLPALTSLRFNGSCEYLEDLIAPIDSPLLDCLSVVFHQPGLYTPQLAQFVNRTPTLEPLHEAHIIFRNFEVSVSLPATRPRGLDLTITRVPSDHFSVIAQLCSSSILRALIPTMKRLYILDDCWPILIRPEGVESSRWLDILRPFTSVEDLYLSQKFSLQIMPALHEIIGEGMTELLPSLQNILLQKESPPGRVEEEAIGRFVAALRLSSRPIAFLQWDRVPWFQNEDR